MLSFSQHSAGEIVKDSGGYRVLESAVSVFARISK